MVNLTNCKSLKGINYMNMISLSTKSLEQYGTLDERNINLSTNIVD